MDTGQSSLPSYTLLLEGSGYRDTSGRGEKKAKEGIGSPGQTQETITTREHGQEEPAREGRNLVVVRGEKREGGEGGKKGGEGCIGLPGDVSAFFEDHLGPRSHSGTIRARRQPRRERREKGCSFSSQGGNLGGPALCFLAVPNGALRRGEKKVPAGGRKNEKGPSV